MRRANGKHLMAAVLGSALGACDTSRSPDPNDNGSSMTAGSGLLYLLQPDAVPLESVIEQPFEWLILEPSRSGAAADEFADDEIASLRTTGPCGGKKVLAYLSVGEAEDYRDYWDPAWVHGDEGMPIPGVAPAWLGPSNPNYPSNYKVRYWDPQWQAIILGTATGPDKTPLDRIIDAGFSGVYLDIIDAYEFWSEPEGGNELSRDEARTRMIEWIQTISDYAKNTRGRPDFLVFPQNASEIIFDDDGALDDLSEDYFAAIDGIGIEDLFYDETTPQSAADVTERLVSLTEFPRRGKTVLVTDYVVGASLSPSADNQRVADFYRKTLDQGFIPYAAMADRGLDEMVILTPPPWSVAQPDGQCAR